MNMSDKKVKDIPGFEGLYAISSSGNVWAYPRNRNKKNNHLALYKGKWLKNKINKRDGYVYIILNKNKKQITRKVHRFVALTFLPNPEKKSQINHKNGIKTDNRVSNLEWCTPSENQKHSVLLGLKRSGDKSPLSKISDKNVSKIRSLYSMGIYSQPYLAKKYGICKVQVWRIINGLRRKNYGLAS